MAQHLSAAMGKVFGVVSAAIDTRWGEQIDWYPWQEGWNKAKLSNKPIMCVITQEECPACERLGKQVARCEDLTELSRDFVMVGLDPSEVPQSADFRPDGDYIPRIIFFTPRGKPLHEVTNINTGNTKYAYGNVTRIMDNMFVVRNKVGRGVHKALRKWTPVWGRGGVVEEEKSEIIAQNMAINTGVYGNMGAYKNMGAYGNMGSYGNMGAYGKRRVEMM